MALWTYNSGDPGWSRTGANIEIKNSGGLLGAWLADLSLSFFGHVAYLFPWAGSVFLVSILRGWFKKSTLAPSPLLLIVRWIGFFLLIIGTCGLFCLKLSADPIYLPGSAGGVVGEFFALHMVMVLNYKGALIVLLSALLTGNNLNNWIVMAMVIRTTRKGNNFIS